MASNKPAFLNAVERGDLQRVQELLADKPDLRHARTENGSSALLTAIYHSRRELVAELLRHSAETDVFEAAALGQTNRLATLLEQQPEAINTHAADGFTPLGLAAFFGQEETVAYLLEQGADVNATSRNAMKVRPLHSAVAHRQPEVALSMAQRLLEEQAAVNVAQHGGWTPLHQAAAHGHLPLVDLLLQYGANRSARSDDGRTPADMARTNGFNNLAEYLTHPPPEQPS